MCVSTTKGTVCPVGNERKTTCVRNWCTLIPSWLISPDAYVQVALCAISGVDLGSKLQGGDNNIDLPSHCLVHQNPQPKYILYIC